MNICYFAYIKKKKKKGMPLLGNFYEVKLQWKSEKPIGRPNKLQDIVGLLA